MRFNEMFTEAPVMPAPTAQPVAQKPGIVDKTLSGAAKVAGAIDTGANAIRTVQDKLKNFGSQQRDPFAAVSKVQLKPALDNIIAGKQLTPQDLSIIKKFASSL
jgi:hypothetical protein